MKIFKNHLFWIIVLLILVIISISAIEFVSGQVRPADHGGKVSAISVPCSDIPASPQAIDLAPYEQVRYDRNFTYYKLNESMMAEYGESKSNKSGITFTDLFNNSGNYQVEGNVTYLLFNTTGVYRPPTTSFREDVIVYFKEMPSSVDGFASSYGVKPIFVRDDIKMAAFETCSVAYAGKKSQSTISTADLMSQDTLVETVKIDTYMFINKSEDLNNMPEVVYPADLEARGIDYEIGKLSVGFWRLPPSLKAFGEKYGGRPEDPVPYGLPEFAVFETADSAGFIDRASKDPYVKSICPPILGHISTNSTVGL